MAAISALFDNFVHLQSSKSTDPALSVRVRLPAEYKIG